MCSEIISDKNLYARLNFILLNWSFCWRLRQDLGEGQMINFPTMIFLFYYCFLPRLDILWSKTTVLDGAGFAVCPQKPKVESVSHQASHSGEFKDTQSHSMWSLPRMWWRYFKIITGICWCSVFVPVWTADAWCRHDLIECKLSVLFLCCGLAIFFMKLLIKVFKCFSQICFHLFIGIGQCFHFQLKKVIEV